MQQNSLVLYKNSPALIKQVGDKLEIQLDSGKSLKVRPKDIVLLHPGPLRSLAELKPRQGEVKVAWELLAGETTTLVELAELIYEEYTPQTAWATWQHVETGLYFRGTPEEIAVATAEAVEREQAVRAAKEAERQAWADFMARIEQGEFSPDDDRYLSEVEQVAYGRQFKSRLLRELNRAESPENAHALLLDVGYWDEKVNPYPQRLAVETTQSTFPLPALPEEERLDLTHLPAFAIDDEGSTDPDDAVSLDGRRLWVHVADVAALIPPDSPADLEARARGANLYLPEGTVTMLPEKATEVLALGLNHISPALSFGLDLGEEGEMNNIEIIPSWVRVERLSYEEAETRLDQEPFFSLYRWAKRYKARRIAHGSIEIDLPEVRVRVNNDGRVVIRPLLDLKSRMLVREAMLMAGEAVAQFALEQDIPFPFTTQEEPGDPGEPLPEGLAGMFALRRTMKAGQIKSISGSHAGLGLETYTRITSPLRRYLDMVAHQQLRAHLRGEPLIESQAMLERVGAAEAVSAAVRQAERLSNTHWTLVYLLQNPDWQGEGIIVENQGRRSLLLIPEFALETRLHLRDYALLNEAMMLRAGPVNLPELDVRFRVGSR